MSVRVLHTNYDTTGTLEAKCDDCRWVDADRKMNRLTSRVTAHVKKTGHRVTTTRTQSKDTYLYDTTLRQRVTR